MPTVLTIFGFKFIIYTKDHYPPHVHVKKAGCELIVEFGTGHVIKNLGFKGHEIHHIVALVRKHEKTLEQKWKEIHGD